MKTVPRPRFNELSHSLARFSVALLVFLFASATHSGAVTTLPAGFTEELIPGPWTEPVGLMFEPDQQTSGGRAYVWERCTSACGILHLRECEVNHRWADRPGQWSYHSRRPEPCFG